MTVRDYAAAAAIILGTYVMVLAFVALMFAVLAATGHVR